jgi:hypothetical protein
MANLTPELLKQLEEYFKQSSSGYTPQGAQEFGGQMFQQNVNQGGYAGEGGDGGSFTPYGYTSYKPGATTGDKWSQYDTKGEFSRDGVLKKVGNGDLIAFLATAASLGMLPGGALNNMMGAPGGVAGPGEAGWGMDLGGGEMFSPAMDSQLANVQGGFSAGGGGVGGVGGGSVGASAPVAGGGGGLLSGLGDKAAGLIGSVTGGGGSNLMGLASTALGALAGSQGQKGENSSTRTMDPRLDQPVFGDLVPRTQNKLAELMTPERMQGYRNMQSLGTNLLGRPVAENKFNRFYPG